MKRETSLVCMRPDASKKSDGGRMSAMNDSHKRPNGAESFGIGISAPRGADAPLPRHLPLDWR